MRLVNDTEKVIKDAVTALSLLFKPRPEPTPGTRKDLDLQNQAALAPQHGLLSSYAMLAQTLGARQVSYANYLDYKSVQKNWAKISVTALQANGAQLAPTVRNEITAQVTDFFRGLNPTLSDAATAPQPQQGQVLRNTPFTGPAPKPSAPQAAPGYDANGEVIQPGVKLENNAGMQPQQRTNNVLDLTKRLGKANRKAPEPTPPGSTPTPPTPGSTPTLTR